MCTVRVIFLNSSESYTYIAIFFSLFVTRRTPTNVHREHTLFDFTKIDFFVVFVYNVRSSFIYNFILSPSRAQRLNNTCMMGQLNVVFFPPSAFFLSSSIVFLYLLVLFYVRYVHVRFVITQNLCQYMLVCSTAIHLPVWPLKKS